MTMWSPEINEAETAIYQSIAEALARDIASGQLKPGDRLPSQRRLSKALSVTVGTIGRAYATAEQAGLISMEVGRGSFVCDPGAANHDSDGRALIDLGMSLPPVIPNDELYARTLSRLARRNDLHRLFWHTPVDGTLSHRQSAANWIGRRMPCNEQQVAICGGTQSGLLMSLSTLTKPGDQLLVESLTFPGILAAAKLLHLKLVPIEMDDQGLTPRSLSKLARQRSVLYCIPTNQNPTGATMSVARRKQIVAIIKQKKMFVVEDDVYGLVAQNAPPPVVSYVPESGILISSLSKTLALGLRLAFVRFPDSMREKLVENLRAIDCFLSPLNIEIASTWIQDGTAVSLMQMRAERLAKRRQLAIDILGEFDFRLAPQANHLWLTLPDEWQAEIFRVAARENNVLINAASSFAVDSATAPNAVRIAIGAAITDSELIEGLKRIKRLIDGVAQQPPQY